MIRLRFRPEITQEADMYTAICKELGLAACAKTEMEAWDKLRQTVRSYCTALERGYQIAIEKALTESGIIWERIDGPEDEHGDMIVDIWA